MTKSTLLTDPPMSLWLWSENDEHAGWMLLVLEKKTSKTCHGKSVFMLTPASVAGIESKLGMVVSDLKVAGEHNWTLVERKSGVSLTVTPDGLPEVRIEFANDVDGKIYTEFDDEIICIGSAQRREEDS